MIDHLDKISFFQLKILVKNLANKLNQHIREKQYDNVCIFHRGKNKSEYWILKLIYPFLDFKIADVIEISNDYDFSTDKNRAVISKLQTAFHSKNSCLILIDDGTYSGAQCADHILHIAYRLEQIRQKQPEYFNESTIELMFGFAYATQHASNLINQSLELLSKHPLPIPCNIESLIKKVHLFYEKRILSTKEMNWGELQTDYETSISNMLATDTMERDRIERLTMVYTDWRTPDNFSSPAAFFKAAPPITLCLEEKKTVVLQSIIDELVSLYHCHTIILYGSRARGDFTSSSDYDVAGIAESAEKKRIARFDEKHGVFHDIFVYPESAFDTISDEYLCMSDGIVIIEHVDFGKKLLKKLSDAIQLPESISPDEITVRKIWYKNMLVRASTRDLEGKYRHIWAIYTIIEDYFFFRGLRYQGPKKAFQYMKIHDSETLLLFEEVLSNTNNVKFLKKLIERVTQ